MGKYLQFNTTYSNLIRTYLSGLLIFLPFQFNISNSDLISSTGLIYLKYIDEITIVFLFPLAIWEIIKYGKHLDCLYLIMGFSIVVFTITGLISGIVNGNSLVVTSIGTFDYIKNFLVIFIYAAFFHDFEDVKKIFNILLILVFALGAVALIQEMWATGGRYLLEKDITDKRLYILTEIYDSANQLNLDDFNSKWKFGIYKAGSLLSDANMLGLYSLLFLTQYVFYKIKMNWVVLLMIFSGVFASGSRMVYTSLLFITLIYFFRDRKWLMIALIPLLILASYISINIADMDSQEDQQSYRSYTRDKSLEIWKDHAYWGVGAGMYGGVVSIKFGSYIYSEYNFNSLYVIGYLPIIGSIDQFWPQLLAETGTSGFIGFTGILLSLVLTLFILIKRNEHYESSCFIKGTLCFMCVFYIYLLGSGMNITLVLFTYLAFIGMALGSSTKLNNKADMSSGLVNNRGVLVD